MKIKVYRLKPLAIILLLSFAAAPINGQERRANVNRVTATTSDKLLFTAWVMRQNINLGQDIVVYYTVENHSRKSIYLVRDNTSQTVIENDNIIFPSPLVLIGGHEAYNYNFTKVARGDSYRGQLKVSRGEYKDAQLWNINVGFGYITNITGLNVSPEQINDPAPFKSLLNSRIRTLLLSGLSVEVMPSTQMLCSLKGSVAKIISRRRRSSRCFSYAAI